MMTRIALPVVLACSVAACSGSDDSGSDPAPCDQSAAVADPSRNPDTVQLVAGLPTDCAADPLTGLVADECTYEVECTSGTRQLTLNQGWTATGVPGETCEPAFDSCPAVHLSCGGGGGHWVAVGGTDEPHICPWEPPSQGSPCANPPMAVDTCGYWCAGKADGTWTVATCTNGTWQFDGACPCL